jgi:hypothetical protein
VQFAVLPFSTSSDDPHKTCGALKVMDNIRPQFIPQLVLLLLLATCTG